MRYFLFALILPLTASALSFEGDQDFESRCIRINRGDVVKWTLSSPTGSFLTSAYLSTRDCRTTSFKQSFGFIVLTSGQSKTYRKRSTYSGSVYFSMNASGPWTIRLKRRR